MIRLEILQGDGQGQVVESNEEVITIGRADTSDLHIDAPHISGEHASIVFTGEVYVVRDHDSTNGTRIKRGAGVIDLAAQPGRELVLDKADCLLLGEEYSSIEVAVHFDDDDDDGSRIVAMRSVADLEEVEHKVNRDLLEGLYSAQRSISTALDLEQVIDAIAAQVFLFLTRATHVTVALKEEDQKGKSRKSSRYIPMGTRIREGIAHHGGAIPITSSVFKKVVKERSAVLAADAKSEVGESASMMAAQILSTIGVPLWEGDQILGVLQVDNRASSGVFKDHDLDVLALLAQSASQGFARARLIHRLRVAEERQRNENTYLKRREERRRFDGIIGESKAMENLFSQLKKVVDTRVTILIEGETGTGKELVASAAHYWSQRRDKLFVAQNCAAMPENLLESELFGHKKGAFTGASEDKRGLFELAHEGTLFLDEVGEMPMPLQAKLLRVLQEGEIRPVGSGRTKRVDVRIVAATNRDLEKEVAEGRFREDLFYRLRVFPLRLPPLRERREDIPLLAGHFLKRYSEEFGRSVDGISQQAMELLQSHRWPGNVRELENEVQRLVIQVDGEDFVQPTHLSAHIRQVDNVIERVQPKKGTLKEMMGQLERTLLRQALEEHGGNKSQTAKSLGITREGLHKKLKNYGMS